MQLLRKTGWHVLVGLEHLFLFSANLPRRLPRRYRRYSSWDLLKAQRVAARLRPDDVVLDVGCGDAHLLDELGLFLRLDRRGVDLHPPKTAPSGVTLEAYDGRRLPGLDRSVDVVIFGHVLHYLSRKHATALLVEASRVARRGILLLEDSAARFSRRYQLRNLFHRWQSDVQYGASSPSRYLGAGDEQMFLTYDGWRALLGGLSRTTDVEIEPLGEISRYAHHTLIYATLGM